MVEAKQRLIETIRDGIFLVNTVYFEGSRVKIIGSAVNPADQPGDWRFTMNGAPMRIDTWKHHEQFSTLYRVEHVYYFEASGEAPPALILKFEAVSNTGGATRLPFYFDTLRPPRPPDEGRSRVHGTGEVNSFDLIGCTLANNLSNLASSILEKPASQIGPVLDWGCGSARVARFLFPMVREPHGIDIDANNIEWCKANVRGAFSTIALDPPTRFAADRFEWIYAISVMTHLNLPDQDAWLAELSRIAKPGALLLISIHSYTSALTYGATADFFPVLDNAGFIDSGHDPRLGDFSPDTMRYRTTYHSPGYIREHWSKWFEVLDILPGWVGGNQDLVVLKKR